MPQRPLDRRALGRAALLAGLVLPACMTTGPTPATITPRPPAPPAVAEAGVMTDAGPARAVASPRAAADVAPATTGAVASGAGERRSRGSRIGLAVLVLVGLVGLSMWFGG